MANLGTTLFTFFFGSKVGSDSFGNVYYQSKKPQNTVGKYNKNRRWVIYNGKPEASKIPAEWHGWLHFTFDTVPEVKINSHFWQKKHTPNLTGTDLAYLPTGHVDKLGKRSLSTGDYNSWKPN